VSLFLSRPRVGEPPLLYAVEGAVVLALAAAADAYIAAQTCPARPRASRRLRNTA
jgi:hypothetical protein